MQCSIPSCHDYDEARRIAVNMIAHALWDYVFAKGPSEEFIAFLGSRWAPVGVANDPTNLNANWIRNVMSMYV